MPSFRISWALAALACAVMLFAVPLPASADLIGSAPQSAPAIHVEAAAATVAAPEQSVLARLEAAGVPSEEALGRLHEMTPADVEVLAASPDQVQVAGAGFAVWPLLVIIAIAAVGALYLLFSNAL